ncbi:MAG: hypothetical protein VX899_03875 [Myxococcota bacterium]|nr:hypothetical protein [Myxococcota bacterium]
MKDRFLPVLLLSQASVAALGLLAVALVPEPPAPRVERSTLPMPMMPAPTENWLGPDAESQNKIARKAWMNDWAHRSPPDVDWKEIERDNGLAQIEKRNALARGAPPPPLPEGQWEERGSDNQAGRMHVATHGPDGMLYAGSSKGGVWRADLDGQGWEELGDNLYGGAHWLEVLDDGRILAATDGGLVHTSDDDGLTWEAATGLDNLAGVRRLEQDRSGGLYMVVAQWIWTDQWDIEQFLVRSDDGGSSWDRLRQLSGQGSDVFVALQGDPERLYLVDGAALWTSSDGGESWVEGPRLPGGDLRIAGSEASEHPTLYVTASDASEVWVSQDGGDSFTKSPVVLDDYWGTLEASQVDPALFAWGGVHVHVTRDAGQSFGIVNRWEDYYGDVRNKLHADIPGLDAVLDERGEEVWYISTDGGLYRSEDGLQSVENLSLQGLRVSQYYDTLTSNVDPDHVHAGAQDQGYQTTQGVSQDDGVLGFEQVLSGDYGHLTSGDGSHHLVFSVYPTFMLVAQGEDSVSLGYVGFPPLAKSYGWLPALAADPLDPEAVLFLADKLYRYDYSTQSGTFEATLHSQQNFQQSSGEYLAALAFAPSDPRVAVGVTSYGRVFTSADGALTWERAQDEVLYGHYFYGHALIIDRDDPQTVYVGGAGYGGDPVFVSRDGGDTWSSMSEGMPTTTVYGMAQAQDGSGRLFAATEQTAYVYDPEQGAWEDLTGNEAPVTTYWSVEILAHENTARFGTYGRGIWDYRMETPACYPVVDADDDGLDCLSDCDDSDAAAGLPGEEICGDGIDQDCDGADLECADTGEEGGIGPRGNCGCSAQPDLAGGIPWLVGVLVLLGFRRCGRREEG